MNLKVRPVEPQDYEALTLIRNQVRPEPISVTDMIEADRANAAEPHYRRLVAEVEGRVAATGWVGAKHGMPEGLTNIGIQVERAHRGHGLGEALRAALEADARAASFEGLEATVRGGDDASYEWALRRGYCLYRQRTEATLDLATFDHAPFAEVVARVAASGITFIGFMGRPPEPYLRGLHEVDNATTHDVPGYGDATLPTYERYVADLEPYFPRTYFQLALDGERMIGLSTLELSADGQAANTGMTGVLREYRGRQIALALKLQTISEAQRLGLKLMRTNNDPDNPPMLAVNQKLGYQFIPGPRRMRKSLLA